VPGPYDTVCKPPEGHTAVFTKHLEFGLRFPFHPFLEQLIDRGNVALCQMNPFAVRLMVAFTWTCLFLNLPLSIDAFR
ncbi:hypothetical protein, partial [Klebsiella variicola]|uniref:hypothetical protein n=1 Tax=Klebsiella variicola TaxID=244366 RepID=UPI00272FD337